MFCILFMFNATIHSLATAALFFRCSTAVNDRFEGERLESVSKTSIELRLELDPMQTQSMQESGKTFHQHENADSQDGPESENNPQCNSTDRSAHLQTILQDHVPQDFSEF